MTSKKHFSVQRNDKAGLQELEENFSIGDQEEASLYDNSLLDKQSNSQVDSLDDSLCMDDETKEEDTLVPSMDTSTMASQHSEDVRSKKLIDGEKDCSLVDELFDDLPVTSQSTINSVETQDNKPEKKIAPQFGNEKKKKRFRAPIQSIANDPNSKEPARDKLKDKPKDQPEYNPNDKPEDKPKGKPDDYSKGKPDDKLKGKPDDKPKSKTDDKPKGKPDDKPKDLSKPKGKSQQTSDKPKSKVEKAKPMFSTKPSAGRKRKSPEESGSNDDKITEPPKKVSKTDVDKQKPGQRSLTSEANIQNTNDDNTNGNTAVEPAASTNSSTLKETSCADEGAKKRKKVTDDNGTSVKRKKKSVDDKTESKKSVNDGEDNGSTGDGMVTGNNMDGKSEVVFKKKKEKTVQQQAKIDFTCKNLEREQRKAEKELKKIDRDLKKARKQRTHKVVKKSTQSQEQSGSSSGDSSGQVWVQCDHPNCLKWRRLKDCNNPSDIPDEWYCNMNPDEQYNSCSAPEEDSSTLSDSQEFVYTSYAPGTLVWAKVTGYPWWPAMVQEDCNKDTFFEKHPSCHTPIAYHVVFFSKPISRAWVHSLCLQLYLPDENPNMKVAQKYNKSLKESVNEADEASRLSVEERLEKYSFEKLYTGKPFDYNQWTGDDDVETKKRKRGAPRKPRRRLKGNSQ